MKKDHRCADWQQPSLTYKVKTKDGKVRNMQKIVCVHCGKQTHKIIKTLAEKK